MLRQTIVLPEKKSQFDSFHLQQAYIQEKEKKNTHTQCKQKVGASGECFCVSCGCFCAVFKNFSISPNRLARARSRALSLLPTTDVLISCAVTHVLLKPMSYTLLVSSFSHDPTSSNPPSYLLHFACLKKVRLFSIFTITVICSVILTLPHSSHDRHPH